MVQLCSIFDKICRDQLLSFRTWSTKAKSFEALNQNSGFVLYETDLPVVIRDPSLLKVEGLGDRAYIYVNQKFVGILSRSNNITSLPITLGLGNKLQILVENEGRINFWIPKDFKGLLGSVEFGGILLQNWTMTGFPFDSYSQIEKLIELYETGKLVLHKSRNLLGGGPAIFLEIFNLTRDQIHDTFLDPTGWGKVSFCS